MSQSAQGAIALEIRPEVGQGFAAPLELSLRRKKLSSNRTTGLRAFSRHLQGAKSASLSARTTAEYSSGLKTWPSHMRIMRSPGFAASGTCVIVSAGSVLREKFGYPAPHSLPGLASGPPARLPFEARPGCVALRE